MSTPERPNLFIVGGPKCGTTALYAYLSRHPEIFMSPIKEPQFFASDILLGQRRVRTLPEYLACFAEASQQRVIGEASTAYLGSRAAARQIKCFSPKAKIIVMLRNPIDVMYAQHSERVFSNMEHILTFETALDSEEIRLFREGPFKGEPVTRLSYRDLSHFTAQVERYFCAFGRENVHTIIYDDFKRDVTTVVRNLLGFLDVCPNVQITCDVVNANRRARSMVVQALLRHPPSFVTHIAKRLLPRSVRDGARERLKRLNIVYEPRPPMARSLRVRLNQEYRGEIDALGALLGRDLSHWYENDV